ncbi:hypothetical protein F4778DRAFT_742651 [Xylariomycetidae sp. FL2044]|nr:hypothetical protein F4778DRAFT_742651 [Xylariomycetidae sp. FL2044]
MPFPFIFGKGQAFAFDAASLAIPGYARLVSFMGGGAAVPLQQQASSSSLEDQVDALENAPIFSPLVEKHIRMRLPSDQPVPEFVPQYGLLGWRLDGPQDAPHHPSEPEDQLVLANVNMPWSAFICGSQGAGKSHTLSCLLESGLLKENPAGKLTHPLAGMVLHYDMYTNSSTTQLCEAAYLCSSLPVTILVSPSNIWTMKRLYSNLPGLSPDIPQPKVLPLYLNENQLDVTRILKLMAVNPEAKEVPLYMDVVMNIARQMAMEGPKFTYSAFRSRLDRIRWIRGQEGPLKMRLQLLDSFMAPSDNTRTTKPAAAKEDIWAFQPGSLTIVDLSDPFVNSNDACTLFSICTSLFLEDRNKCGRMLALDEAHKFLTASGEAEVLTADLLSIIRQQRHTGTRVVIATQEPTLAPELIDLANVTFVHRFLSPKWYQTLERHLAGANREVDGTLFETIVSLRTGEALLFCPTALLDVCPAQDATALIDLDLLGARPMGSGYIKLQVRKRLTTDGGRSIMATDALAHGAPQTADVDVPMYTVVARAPVQSQAAVQSNRPAKLPPAPAPAPAPARPPPNAQVSGPTPGSQPPVSTSGSFFKAPTGKEMRPFCIRLVNEKVSTRKWLGLKPSMQARVSLCFELEAAMSLPRGAIERSHHLFELYLGIVGNHLKDIRAAKK